VAEFGVKLVNWEYGDCSAESKSARDSFAVFLDVGQVGR
jgi:hypothetical protein